MNILNSYKLPDFAAGAANLADNTWSIEEPEYFFDIELDA